MSEHDIDLDMLVSLNETCFECGVFIPFGEGCAMPAEIWICKVCFQKFDTRSKTFKEPYTTMEFIDGR